MEKSPGNPLGQAGNQRHLSLHEGRGNLDRLEGGLPGHSGDGSRHLPLSVQINGPGTPEEEAPPDPSRGRTSLGVLGGLDLDTHQHACLSWRWGARHRQGGPCDALLYTWAKTEGDHRGGLSGSYECNGGQVPWRRRATAEEEAEGQTWASWTREESAAIASLLESPVSLGSGS